MNLKDDLEQKVRIATMYYRQDMTQQEIADALNISRPKVSRLLDEAKQEGIVTINIKNISIHQYNLENLLVKKYNLMDACVVLTSPDPTMVMNDLGTVFNELLGKLATGNVRIGISAGTTLAGLIYRLKPVGSYRIDIYQMCGDASHQMSNCSSYLTIDMAKVLNGIPHAIHVPLLVNSGVLRDLLLEEPVNKQHFDSLKHLDIAVVGLGRLESILPNTSDSWYNFAQEKAELEKMQVVGDVCGIFLDNEGKVVDSPISKKTITIAPDVLTAIPQRIAVAIGKEKRSIAMSAIRCGFINSIICDQDLAYALLED